METKSFISSAVSITAWEACIEIVAAGFRRFRYCSESLGKGGQTQMTEQEELYAKFFNKGKLLVIDMDMAQLRQHIEELSEIAFEAKAILAGAMEVEREKQAKTNKKQWLVTPTEPNFTTTGEAINNIKVRKDRMTKIDKLQAQLLNIGLDPADVKDMIRNMSQKATDKNLKTVTFKRQTEEIAAVTVQSTPDSEPKKAFNWGSVLKKTVEVTPDENQG